jgi:hypothetical protein
MKTAWSSRSSGSSCLTLWHGSWWSEHRPGIAWIELAQRGRIGWGALPAFFLIFGVGVAWIRGYHQKKDGDSDIS